MKRATITFPDELEAKLEAYLSEQAAPPTLSKLVQVALDEYLTNQEWLKRQVRLPQGPLRITPAEVGSGESDISLNHDDHVTDKQLEPSP